MFSGMEGATARGNDALAIDALMYRNYIARLGKVSSMLDRAKRRCPRARIRVTTTLGDMEFRGAGRRQRQE